MFQEEAVNAAIHLMNERANTGTHVLVKPKEVEVVPDKNSSTDWQSFNTALFFRSLSYRDFVTSFSLVIFYLAFSEILNYYSDERFIENTEVYFLWSCFILLIIFNHVLYKIEHRRSNNYIGRWLHDVIFLFTYFLVMGIHKFIALGSYNFSAGENAVIAIFFMLIVIFIFEFILEIIKQVLGLFKWQLF